MKKLFALLVFILGIGSLGFGSTLVTPEDDKDTISTKSDYQTIVCELAYLDSIKLELSDYVYFIPINGDIYAIIIKQNDSQENQSKIFEAYFSLRERKKWVRYSDVKQLDYKTNIIV